MYDVFSKHRILNTLSVAYPGPSTTLNWFNSRRAVALDMYSAQCYLVQFCKPKKFGWFQI